MSAKANIATYDESLINFFDEFMTPHADQLYRLAFALTLSLDGALQLVNETFKKATKDLKRFYEGRDHQPVLSGMMMILWQAFLALKEKTFAEGSGSMIQALRGINVEARAALIAVDVMGLAPSEAARVFSWSELDLRQKLASARRALLQSNLS